MMHDLKKLEEKFHEFLTDGLKEGTYDRNKLPKLTEKLFTELGELRWIYYFRYYLTLEDKKPVLYIRAYSTIHDMDETFVELYMIWMKHLLLLKHHLTGIRKENTLKKLESN